MWYQQLTCGDTSMRPAVIKTRTCAVVVSAAPAMGAPCNVPVSAVQEPQLQLAAVLHGIVRFTHK